MAALVDQWNARNGLVGTSQLNFKQLDSIYRVCGYEIAIYRHSPWCDLFTVSELKVMEFLDDVLQFNEAYDTKRRAIGNYVMMDVVAKMQDAVQRHTRGSAIKQVLYFTYGFFVVKTQKNRVHSNLHYLMPLFPLLSQS